MPTNADSKNKPIYLEPNQIATFYKSSSKIEKTKRSQSIIDNKIEPKQIERIVINPKANPTPITSWKDKEWVFDHGYVKSKSENSCFYGRKLKGKVLHNFVNGTHHTP